MGGTLSLLGLLTFVGLYTFAFNQISTLSLYPAHTFGISFILATLGVILGICACIPQYKKMAADFADDPHDRHHDDAMDLNPDAFDDARQRDDRAEDKAARALNEIDPALL